MENDKSLIHQNGKFWKLQVPWEDSLIFHSFNILISFYKGRRGGGEHLLD